jgi:UDP:flavonoid glycosyltransferase YjiC (YdhE family)
VRVLFTAHGAYGHVLPLVGVAQALQRAGHHVRFAVAEDIHPTLTSLGLQAHAAGLSDAALVAEARRRWAEALHEPPARWALRMFAEIAAPAMARDVRTVIDAWRPHVVVREEGEYGAPIAAAAAGVAWVTHGWGSPPPTAADRARVAAMLAPYWGATGRPPLDGDDLYGAGVIDPCPPSLSGGSGVSAPRCPTRPEVVELRADAEPVALGDGELAYVGFGTVPIYRDNPGLLMMLVRSLLAAGLRPVVTTSDASIAADLRAIDRGGVEVRRWVSLPHLLPACRLAVCHGGAGTVLASLTAGIPLLLLPRGAPSQLRMSTACAERGVARLVAPNDVSAGTIEEALGDLMKDGRFCRNAHELAEEVAAMPGPRSVVPCLELAGRAT